MNKTKKITSLIARITIITLSSIFISNNISYANEVIITVTKTKKVTINKNLSVQNLVSKIKVGWNLGNTLDAEYPTWISNPTVREMESAWCKIVTTKAMINKVKKAGFNAIRIPVTWNKCMDKDYKINKKWMKRVKEVVDYAIDNDMYVIINNHHDEKLFDLRNDKMTTTKKAFKKLWQQIAKTFKDYDEHLIFESLNEPRVEGYNTWSGGTKEIRSNINKLNKIFVNLIRSSGGNNKYRALMIPTHAASSGETEVNALVLPKDDRIIISIHMYSPYEFALNPGGTSVWSASNKNDTLPIKEAIDRLYNKFTSKGVPVIIGEFGAVDKNNLKERAAWAKYYVSYAKSKNIPCFWWDNHAFKTNGENFAILDRTTLKWQFPEIVNALMKGVK